MKIIINLEEEHSITSIKEGQLLHIDYNNRSKLSSSVMYDSIIIDNDGHEHGYLSYNSRYGEWYNDNNAYIHEDTISYEEYKNYQRNIDNRTIFSQSFGENEYKALYFLLEKKFGLIDESDFHKDEDDNLCFVSNGMQISIKPFVYEDGNFLVSIDVLNNDLLREEVCLYEIIYFNDMSKRIIINIVKQEKII